MTDEQRARWFPGTVRIPPHHIAAPTWTMFANGNVADPISRVVQYGETTFGIHVFGANIDAVGNRWPRTQIMLTGSTLNEAVNEAETQLESLGWSLLVGHPRTAG